MMSENDKAESVAVNSPQSQSSTEWPQPLPDTVSADVSYESSFAAQSGQSPQMLLVPADKVARWFAWGIDLLIVVGISLFALIPLLGGIMVAIMGTSYLLLRDFQGASLGKRAMGLRVVGKEGQPASSNALILRNLFFALPYLFHFIPFLGIFLTLLFWVPVCVIEGFCALLKGERIGDMLAGTRVVKA